MKISKNTWHYMAFAFWYEQSHNGCTIDEYQERWGKECFNLCPYVRIVLFWAPLRFLFSRPRIWYVLGTVALSLLSVLYHFHGVVGLEKLGIIIAVIAFVIGFVIGAILLTDWFARKWRQTSSQNGIKAFTTVLTERAKAAHDGVCPLIDFVEE